MPVRRIAYPQLLTTLLVLCFVLSTLPAAAGDETDEVKRLLGKLKEKDPLVRSEAALAAQDLQDSSLAPTLLHLLADKELTVREAVLKTMAVWEDKSTRRKAASKLNPRLAGLAKHPADQEEFFLTIETLGKLKQRSSIKPLLDGINLETETEEVQARLSAVGEIPDPEAIERLIQFLDKGRRRGGRTKQRNIANKVLRVATGANPGGSGPEKWRAWWRENKRDFDFEAVAQARADAEAAAKERAEKKKKNREKRKKKKGKGGKKKGGRTPPEPEKDA
jgi:hypothetical protein